LFIQVDRKNWELFKFRSLFLEIPAAHFSLVPWAEVAAYRPLEKIIFLVDNVQLHHFGMFYVLCMGHGPSSFAPRRHT
jgi:hypothetical protein